MATALWAPKATNLEAPQETLLTIRLQPAPMKTLYLTPAHAHGCLVPTADRRAEREMMRS